MIRFEALYKSSTPQHFWILLYPELKRRIRYRSCTGYVLALGLPLLKTSLNETSSSFFCWFPTLPPVVLVGQRRSSTDRQPEVESAFLIFISSARSTASQRTVMQLAVHNSLIARLSPPRQAAGGSINTAAGMQNDDGCEVAVKNCDVMGFNGDEVVESEKERKNTSAHPACRFVARQLPAPRRLFASDSLSSAPANLA